MSPPRGKWFTCTPIRFNGDHTFFARDSGLLCKGFQEIGVECKAIMPGPPMENDQVADLIRTEYSNLADAEWWKSLGGEGVVFYGWGDGKYLAIARAIKRSGLILVSNMDTAGLFSMLNGVADFSASLWRVAKGERGESLGTLAYSIAQIGFAVTLGLVKNDFRRALHLRKADVIGAISPLALERIRKVCRFYGGAELVRRVQLVPHPNASYMIADPAIPKERLVVAVGRWDDAQVKGTALLLETGARIAAGDPQVIVEIYGRTTPVMEAWHRELPAEQCQRIRLMGIVPNIEVRRALQRARVSLCTSLREGYHTVSAEALCCGCSIVGPDVAEIPSMKWFTDGPFGRMAERTTMGLAQAVLAEFAAWDAGQRDAADISRHWAGILHAPRVAERILELADRLGDAGLGRASGPILSI